MLDYVEAIHGLDTMEYTIQEPSRQFWRVNHDNPLWRYNVPEVFRIFPFHHVVLDKDVQMLWWGLNPTLSPNKMSALFSNDLAFCNWTGFPGHANYILEEDLEKKPPKFDQARLCGGAILSGREDGNKLWIDAINVNQPLPSVDYVLAHPWLYFDAVTIRKTAGVGPTIGRFMDGSVTIKVPILVEQPAYVYLNKFDEWNGLTRLPPGSAWPSPYQYP